MYLTKKLISIEINLYAWRNFRRKQDLLVRMPQELFIMVRLGLANISRLMKLNRTIRFRGQVHCRPRNDKKKGRR